MSNSLLAAFKHKYEVQGPASWTSPLSLQNCQTKKKRSVHKPKGRWELYKLILIHSLHLRESVIFLSTFTHFHCIIYPRLLYLSSVALGFSPDCQLRSVSLSILCCLIFLSPLQMTDGSQTRMVSSLPTWSCTSAFGSKWSAAAVLWHVLCSECLRRKKEDYPRRGDACKQQIKRSLFG